MFVAFRFFFFSINDQKSSFQQLNQKQELGWVGFEEDESWMKWKQIQSGLFNLNLSEARLSLIKYLAQLFRFVHACSRTKLNSRLWSGRSLIKTDAKFHLLNVTFDASCFYFLFLFFKLKTWEMWAHLVRVENASRFGSFRVHLVHNWSFIINLFFLCLLPVLVPVPMPSSSLCKSSESEERRANWKA